MISSFSTLTYGASLYLQKKTRTYMPTSTPFLEAHAVFRFLAVCFSCFPSCNKVFRTGFITLHCIVIDLGFVRSVALSCYNYRESRFFGLRISVRERLGSDERWILNGDYHLAAKNRDGAYFWMNRYNKPMILITEHPFLRKVALRSSFLCVKKHVWDTDLFNISDERWIEET